MAPHIALHEVGVPFEPRPLSFARMEQRRPEFLAINPEGKVPVLVIDGRPLTEVAGILFYLAKRFPEAGLLPPGDVETEAQAVSWMSFIAATIHPARRLGVERGQAIYRLTEQRLGQREWVLGTFSIVDIHLFRLFWRFSRAYPTTRAMCPALAAHHDRMMTRPAVQRTCEIEAAIGYELPG